MAKGLLVESIVENIHALKRGKQRVRNAGRDDLYGPSPTQDSMNTLFDFIFGSVGKQKHM